MEREAWESEYMQHKVNNLSRVGWGWVLENFESPLELLGDFISLCCPMELSGRMEMFSILGCPIGLSPTT